MNELEKHMQHEIIKKLMKQAIDDNPFPNSIQNEQQKARVDLCAAQADRIENMLRRQKIWI